MPVRPQRLLGEDVIGEGFRPLAESFADGRPVRLLRAAAHRLRNAVAESLFENVFLVQSPDFPMHGQTAAEIDHPPIEKGMPQLQRMGHGDPVALGGEEKAGEKRGEFQKLRLVQTVAPGEAGRQQIAQGILRGPAGAGCPPLRRQESQIPPTVFPAEPVGEKRIVDISRAHGVEVVEEATAAGRIGENVGIQPFQQQGAAAGGRFPGPIAPDFGFLENIVAAEDLVGPFAGEHHLEAALLHLPRQEEKGRRGGSQQRLFAMPNDGREMLTDLGAAQSENTMAGADEIGGLLLKHRFVEGSLPETQGEGMQVLRAFFFRRESGENGGIETAAQIGAHRHVRPQPQADRILHQGDGLLAGIGKRSCPALLWRIIRHRPPGLFLHFPRPNTQPVPGGQFAHRGKRGSGRERVPEGQRLADRFRVEVPGNAGMLENGFDFRGEHQLTAGLRQIKRPDPDPVAGEKKFTAEGIPDGQGELAVDSLETERPVFLEKVQHHFGIGRRREAMPRLLQFNPQFLVIEGFAVKDDPESAILVAQRLNPPVETDDAQPGVTQTNTRRRDRGPTRPAHGAPEQRSCE